MAILWRCFPWDRDAAPGSPFSASYLTPGQTAGRFDMQDDPPVRYLAESPDHAIGEVLAPFRGRAFRLAHLRQKRRPLALVPVTLSASASNRIVDCTDPAALSAHRVGPDELAHHDRVRTQAIARRIYHARTGATPPTGFRWWSALTGAWHTVIVFTDRESPGDLTFGLPRELRPDDENLLRAIEMLGITRMRR